MEYGQEVTFTCSEMICMVLLGWGNQLKSPHSVSRLTDIA